MNIAGFESFPATFAYQSDGYGILEIEREAVEYEFTDKEWRDLSAGMAIEWRSKLGVLYTVIRADDPLDRTESLVPWQDAEVELAIAEWRNECADFAWMD